MVLLLKSLAFKPRQLALDEFADGRNARAAIQFFSPSPGFNELANLIFQLRSVNYLLNQNLKLGRYDAKASFDPVDSQNRAQDVEVLLDPHLRAFEVVAVPWAMCR